MLSLTAAGLFSVSYATETLDSALCLTRAVWGSTADPHYFLLRAPASLRLNDMDKIVKNKKAQRAFHISVTISSFLKFLKTFRKTQLDAGIDSCLLSSLIQILWGKNIYISFSLIFFGKVPFSLACPLCHTSGTYVLRSFCKCNYIAREEKDSP